MVWWSTLTVFSQVFWGIALFGSVFLVMQVIGMFLGLEHVGSDASADIHDGDTGHGGHHHGTMAGMKLITMRTMVAFICMFGWTGVVMIEYHTPKILACITATVVGSFSMFLMAALMKFMYSLQTSGNINESLFVGKQATVYIAIPESGKGIGKINFNIGGKLEERAAVSSGTAISPGSIVKTISYNNNTFTVERA